MMIGITAPPPSSSSTSLTPKHVSPAGVESETTLDFRRRILTYLIEEGYWVKMTGSRVTQDGWTSESDWDYVVFDPDKNLGLKFRPEYGWVTGSEAGCGEFTSLKLDSVNLILVNKEDVWKKYIIASNLIKTLNSKTKAERIAVFDSVFGKDKNANAVDFMEPPF